MLLGTYRNEERPDLPQQLPGVHALVLDRLHDEAINQLSQAMLGAQGADPQLLSTLIQETEGNTFFIVEVMRAWAEEAGQLGAIRADTLSTEVFTRGMDELLQRRIRQVAVQDQGLLQLAAVAGRQLDPAVLGKLTDPITLAPWLQHCDDAAILNVVAGNWQFAHDKLREALLLQLAYDEKQALHRQVAEATEATYPDDSAYYPILLEHWYQAGDLDQEIHYLDPVAETLINYTAEYKQAQLLLERGLSVLAPDDDRRVALLNWQTQALRLQSLLNSAQEYALQARELALQANDQHGLGTSIHNLGHIFQRQSELDQALEFYQQSLSIRQTINDRIGMGFTTNNIGSISLVNGNIGEAVNCFRQALDIANDQEDRRLQYVALINLGAGYQQQGQYDQAETFLHQVLDRAQALGDLQFLHHIWSQLGICARNQKKRDDAYHYYVQALEIATKLNLEIERGASLNNLGLLLLDIGRYEEAENYFTESIEIKKIHGSTWDIPSTYNNLGFLYLKTQDNRAWGTFQSALSLSWSSEIIPLVLESLIGLAFLYLQQNQLIESAELVGLVQHHPNLIDDVRFWIDELLPELEQVLDPTNLQVALERGKGLDLKAVVQDLLSALA